MTDVDRVAAELVDYVLTTRHDERFSDAGVRTGLENLLDDLAAAYALDPEDPVVVPERTPPA